jgi:hypothetical protein
MLHGFLSYLMRATVTAEPREQNAERWLARS